MAIRDNGVIVLLRCTKCKMIVLRREQQRYCKPCGVLVACKPNEGIEPRDRYELHYEE